MPAALAEDDEVVAEASGSQGATQRDRARATIDPTIKLAQIEAAVVLLPDD